MIPRVVVVGLGPGGPDLLTEGTRAAIAAASHRYVRTTRHPSASVVERAISFDDVYEGAATLDEVYPEIVERLVAAAAEHGEVLYAVPGSPVVAERTVELLRADPRVECEVLPALSFLDLTWARLGVDPVAVGVRTVDGHRFAVDAAGERGPLLVGQCDSLDVLSDIKLALDAGPDPCLPDGATVTVLQRLGLPEEQIVEVAWDDLDRGVVVPDHLTSVWIPELAAPVSREVAAFVDLVAVLRRECPWDREQTHQSLRRHLLEEAYEVLEALDAVDPETGAGYEHLEEELGDLLFQVVFHTTLATEEGQFTLADVARGIDTKLRVRHPHVFPGGPFGAVTVGSADDVVTNWEQIKKAEKGRSSVFDGIPTALPALLYALKVQKKASAIGTETTVAPADLDGSDEAAVGELLYAVVDTARLGGVDPEQALRLAAQRHRDRARAAEVALPDV